MASSTPTQAKLQRSLPHTVLPWLAVAATLGIAVAAAAGGSYSGLSVEVATVADEAAGLLAVIGAALPLGFAFALGMTAAVNPCGFALLPSYLGLYLGTTPTEHRPWAAQVGRALQVSAAMTISFVVLFGAAGLLLGALGEAAGQWLPWISMTTGVVLAVVGGRLLAGGSLSGPAAERLADRLGPVAQRTGLLGYAAYGVAFALSSLGCTLPLFLTVVGAGLARGGVVGALNQFVLYALGMGLVVSVLTVLFGLLGRAAVVRVRSAGAFLQPLSAVLLLATGGYIVYYWLSAGGLFG
jgi:cytochrome c-type biogenesis protein